MILYDNTIAAPMAVAKAINRWVRKNLSPGWDYATWCAVYPQMALEFNKAVEAISGRKGRFLPRFFDDRLAYRKA
jgi:hypothetical protein